jgi:hypothetical protein
MQGESSYTPFQDTQALVLRAKTVNGEWSILGVIGWHADEKKFVETDYTSGNIWSRREFTKITAQCLSGSHESLAENGKVRGKLEYRRVDKDHMQLVADQPNGNGKITVDFVRIVSQE